MRKSPYVISLLPLLLTTGLTLFSLLTPSLFLATQTPRSDALQTTAKFGLFERCERTVQKPYLPPSLLDQNEAVLETGDNGLGLMMMDRPVGEVPGRNPRKSNETDLGTWYCEPFPTRSTCQDKGTQSFCFIWVTSSYLALLSALPLLLASLAILVIVVGAGERQVRKDRRRRAWKGVAGCVLASAALQATTLGLIGKAALDEPRRFSPYFRPKPHFSLYTLSVSLLLSLLLFSALTYTGLSARAGKTWAAGQSAHRGHKRGKSGGSHRSHRSTRSRREGTGGSTIAGEGGVKPPDERTPLVRSSSA